MASEPDRFKGLKRHRLKIVPDRSQRAPARFHMCFCEDPALSQKKYLYSPVPAQMPPRGSRRVLESSRKASYSHRGIARKPNYTLLLSLCPAAKRHGIRIKEMCLTVNNILGYSIDSCRDYLNQTYLIFDSGQTDCHSGLFCLGSLFFCHPEKESLRAL